MKILFRKKQKKSHATNKEKKIMFYKIYKYLIWVKKQVKWEVAVKEKRSTKKNKNFSFSFSKFLLLFKLVCILSYSYNYCLILNEIFFLHFMTLLLIASIVDCYDF